MSGWAGEGDPKGGECELPSVCVCVCVGGGVDQGACSAGACMPGEDPRVAMHVRMDLCRWLEHGARDACHSRAAPAGRMIPIIRRSLLYYPAIYRAAGPHLLAACQLLPSLALGVRCQTGGAVITGPGDLDQHGVIMPSPHTLWLARGKAKVWLLLGLSWTGGMGNG